MFFSTFVKSLLDLGLDEDGRFSGDSCLTLTESLQDLGLDENGRYSGDSCNASVMKKSCEDHNYVETTAILTELKANEIYDYVYSSMKNTRTLYGFQQASHLMFMNLREIREQEMLLEIVETLKRHESSPKQDN